MIKRFTLLLLSISLIALGLNAQTLDPSITWAKLEKISLGGQELVVSSGNDGRNQIQYWNRSATLVIGDKLFFKAAPPADPVIDSITTTYVTVEGTTLGILASELANFTNHCGEGTILHSEAHPGGNADSLQIYCQTMRIDTTWLPPNYVHQLWFTEGTNESTKRVPNTENLKEPMHLIEANGHLFFTAIDQADDVRYIYRFNGTATAKVSVYPNPYGLSQFGDEILFGVEGPNNDFYTCITDASQAAGSRIISTDIGPAPNSKINTTTLQWSQYAPFQIINKRDNSGLLAIFFGKDRKKGVEICVTDGLTASVILDINDAPNEASTDPEATLDTERGDIIIAVNKYQAAFRVVTPGKWGRDSVAVNLQQNMWITDGTASGTWLFEDMNRDAATPGGLPGTGNSFAGDPFLFKGKLYLTGQSEHGRQIQVFTNTYPNHVTNGTSREEWILNGPDDALAYGNASTGYFGTYGDYMAFSLRVTHFTSNPNEGVLNKKMEHALVVGNKYEDLWVADEGAEKVVPGNGNGAMVEHITQYKDKLYYNRFNENTERNFRVYIKADMANAWAKDTSFWLGSFNEVSGNNANGSVHNLRVMNGSLFFIYKNELYRFTDTQSTVQTPAYDYRDPQHYMPERVRDWETCIFDYGYGGEDTMADDCPCKYVKVGVKEIVKLNDIAVYPNPTSDILNVKVEGYEIASFKVYDLKGNKVIDRKFDSNTIDVSGLVNGSYFIGLTTTDNKFLYSRFMKK